MPINKFLYFGDFVVIPLVMAAFAFQAYWREGFGAAPAFLASLVAGLIVWTFAEYWIHRELYHHAPFVSKYHDLHHEAPKALIGIPSFLSSAIVLLLSYAPFVAFAPVFADGFACGALIGYALYMLVHHATHHWTIEPGDWLYSARVRHLAHHYHDDANFGVVTGFWDRVFGTTGKRRNRLAGA